MALLPIRTYGDPVLRRTAMPVKEITPEVRELAADMAETMFEAPGIGLAAPQVGRSLRLFVIDPSFGEQPGEYVAFINPLISDRRGEDEVIEEGCLSIPDIRAEVERPGEVTIEFTTLDGERMKIEADEMLARVVQHEYDHLDGKLFVDRVGPVRRQMLSGQLKAMARETSKARKTTRS